MSQKKSSFLQIIGCSSSCKVGWDIWLQLITQSTPSPYPFFILYFFLSFFLQALVGYLITAYHPEYSFSFAFSPFTLLPCHLLDTWKKIDHDTSFYFCDGQGRLGELGVAWLIRSSPQIRTLCSLSPPAPSTTCRETLRYSDNIVVSHYMILHVVQCLCYAMLCFSMQVL